MICESECRSSEVAFDSKVTDGEFRMSSKTSCTIGELLSLAEVNVTKELPTEFDRSILRTNWEGLLYEDDSKLLSGTPATLCSVRATVTAQVVPQEESEVKMEKYVESDVVNVRKEAGVVDTYWPVTLVMPDSGEGKQSVKEAYCCQTEVQEILQYSRKRKRGRPPHSQNKGNVNKRYEAAANDLAEDQLQLSKAFVVLEATGTSGQGEGQGSTDMSVGGAASASASYADMAAKAVITKPRHVSRPPMPVGLKHPAKFTSAMTSSIFMLSLSHQKAVKQLERMTSEAAEGLPNLRNFSVHWLVLEPEPFPRVTPSFDPLVPPEGSVFYRELLRCMPTFTHPNAPTFWKHEWEQHGNQPIYTQEEYFYNCCILRDFFDFRAMLSAEVRMRLVEGENIADRNGVTSSWRSLKAKYLVKVLAKDARMQQCYPRLSCEFYKGKWYLLEIHVKLDHSLQHIKSFGADWKRGGFSDDDKIYFFS